MTYQPRATPWEHGAKIVKPCKGVTYMGDQEEIKKSSSVWVKNQDDKLRSFAWQAGYGAFSVGASQVPVLLSYIDNQWEHHHSSTFKEEFLNFLNRYGIEYAERYLWA